MSQSILDQSEELFVSHNKLRGKKFEVTGMGGPKRALSLADLVDKGVKAFDTNG